MSSGPNYDHRDIIIQRLQQEVEELRKNEQDYSDLNFLLTNLEHRYNLLNEEKIRNENDFTQRQEENLKNMADLQCALDNHKQLISKRDQELEEVYIQLSALKDLEKHKDHDFEQIKQELYDVSSAYNNLKEENISLETQARKLEEEKVYVEGEIEKLHHLVEETYEKHVSLGKDNKFLSETIEKQNQELDLYKAEINKKSNEIKDLMLRLEKEREDSRRELKEAENNFREKIEQQKRDFKIFEERMYDENERNHMRFSEELEREHNDAEEKNLEFANINKEMLKQLEEIFESEEKIRERLESKRKIKDQNSLQEKSIKIALKELQEELLMGRVNNYVSKGPEILKNSISKRNKSKLQD